MARSHSSGSTSTAVPAGPPIPTLFTRTSSLPHRRTVSATATRHESASPTSASNTNASPPSRSTISRVSSAQDLTVSSSATLAPSRASSTDVARPFPMPPVDLEPAPVTIATLPANRLLLSPPRSMNGSIAVEHRPRRPAKLLSAPGVGYVLPMRFEPTELTDAELALQEEVREFLATELPRGTFRPGLGMGADRDPAFSRKLAGRGWVGMALPRRYGGGDRTAVERFVVVEELLRWGAPVGHHWVADRQTGPVINRFGTEAQKERFLPPICAGQLSFSIGMSEPDSGSDLASLKTRATRVEGGWLLNGTKVWTSGAHVNDWFIVLARTSDEADRHEGLSQLLVDLRSSGLRVNPIPFLDGTTHFNEVLLTEVFVPDELVLGEVGMGWAQNTSELAYERGGPDRWLSTYLVLEHFLRERAGCDGDGRVAMLLGEATAQWWALRRLSLSVARMIDRGVAPAVESSLVKEMGTRFEQDVLERVLQLVDLEPSTASASLFERLLARAILTAPSFTIRGGTNEILRSVAARGLRP